MTRFIPNSAALALAALLPLSPLGATPLQLAPDATVTLPAVDPSTIDARWADAERLRASGNLRESLRTFQEIAAIQEEYHLNAMETWWTIAEVRNALGDALGTAHALDAAASEAAKIGNVDLQARALMEAAVNYTGMRQFRTSNERVAMVQRLLDSPAMSEGVRIQLQQRLTPR